MRCSSSFCTRVKGSQQPVLCFKRTRLANTRACGEALQKQIHQNVEILYRISIKTSPTHFRCPLVISFYFKSPTSVLETKFDVRCVVGRRQTDRQQISNDWEPFDSPMWVYSVFKMRFRYSWLDFKALNH